MINKNLGFIGFGNMASAIWNGLDSAQLVNPKHVFFHETNSEKETSIQQRYSLKPTDLHQLVETCHIILICVKPQHIMPLLKQIAPILKEQLHTTKPSPLFISIAAGISIQTLEAVLGHQVPLARVMPNAPALVGEGMTAAAINSSVSAEEKNIIHDLFSSFGKTMDVQESQMEAVTGLSGSSPAFLYRIAQTMIEVGIEHGLSHDQASGLVAQTFIGAGQMLFLSGKSPQDLIQEVASPKGTTEAGLLMFDKKGLDHGFQQVIQSAIQRSKDISDNLKGNL